MGKSTASCFKIITCGNDSGDHDDIQSKASSDRRGWSFRKNSARHRVLSNTVILETPSSANKESPESTAVDSQQPNLNVPEKTSVIQWTEEKTKLSAQMDSELSDLIAATEDECKADPTYDESSIILIQAAIRGYLARILLMKQKNAIKLQAAVRGHLVRKHAIGTLRCVQAIVKMQALVRARHFEKHNRNSEHDILRPNLSSENTEAKPNSTSTNTSIEKLLSNKFARQLMEAAPRKKKPINIKCDPSKSDSSWKWLERWMSVSSEKENIGHLGPSGETSENEDSLITYEAENLDLHPNLQQNIDESNSSIVKQETDFISKVEVEKFSTEQPENEAIKFSRKASNPAFIAAQSKFEELTSADKTSISNSSAVQIAHSECGTELSISSTLDSPDRSEADLKHEPEILNATDNNPITENLLPEANENTSLDRHDENADSAHPDSSPRSHISVPESQATPSNQVSVKPKKKRSDRSLILTPNHDSEHKTGKRRNSFSVAKADLDQEPRESSSSSNSLPSYMQATKSAKAKLILNGSPKSNPDDKDAYIKHRLSLPAGTNGRQGSPRVQRPQTKGNGIHSPQERKWRR